MTYLLSNRIKVLGWYAESSYGTPTFGTALGIAALNTDTHVHVVSSTGFCVGSKLSIAGQLDRLITSIDGTTVFIDPVLTADIANDSPVIIQYKKFQGYIKSVNWKDNQSKTPMKALLKQDVLPIPAGTKKCQSGTLEIEYLLGGDLDLTGSAVDAYASVFGNAIGKLYVAGVEEADYLIGKKRLHNEKMTSCSVFLRETGTDTEESYAEHLFTGCVLENTKIRGSTEDIIVTLSIKYQRRITPLYQPNDFNIQGSGWNSEGGDSRIPSPWLAHNMRAQGHTTIAIKPVQKVIADIPAGSYEILVTDATDFNEDDYITIYTGDSRDVGGISSQESLKIGSIDANVITVETEITGSYLKDITFVKGASKTVTFTELEINLKNATEDIPALDVNEYVKEIVGTEQEYTISLTAKKENQLLRRLKLGDPIYTFADLEVTFAFSTTYKQAFNFITCCITTDPGDDFNSDIKTDDDEIELSATDILYYTKNDVYSPPGEG